MCYVSVRDYCGVSEWQTACLSLDSVQKRRNLIYSLPTSGGKTLVAEILIFKEILCRKQDALLILPYVALVQEKVNKVCITSLKCLSVCLICLYIYKSICLFYIK